MGWFLKLQKVLQFGSDSMTVSRTEKGLMIIDLLLLEATLIIAEKRELEMKKSRNECD